MIKPLNTFSTRSVISLCCLILFVSSCNGAKPKAQEIDFTIAGNWQHCPINKTTETNKKYLVYFGSSATAAKFLKAELPSKYQNKDNTSYLLLAHGQKNSGGFGVEASTAQLTEATKLVISAEFTEPKAGHMVTMALTSPCALLAFNYIPALQEIRINTIGGEHQLSAIAPFDAPETILTSKEAPKKQPKAHWQP